MHPPHRTDYVPAGTRTRILESLFINGIQNSDNCPLYDLALQRGDALTGAACHRLWI